MGFKWRKFHSAVIIMLSMVLLFSIYTVPVTAEGERDTVRFGFYKSEKYGYTDANGDWRGFDVHIVKTIGMYGNFNAEVHGYDTVTEMEEALRKGEVDALVDFIHTDKRDSEFIFTDNILLNEKVNLFTHNAPDAPVIKDITEARNLRIGSLLSTGYRDYFINYCLEHGFTPNLIEFNSEKELRQAMEQGLVDVCLTGSAVPAGCRFLLSTVSLSSYIMLRADSSALRDRIDLAMNLLTTDYPNYIPNLHDQYTTNVQTDMTPLAPNEKKYLAEHPVISVALTRHSEPFVIEKKDGSLGGIIPDYYKSLGEKLGVSFRFVVYESTQDTIDAVSKGEADILSHYYSDIVIAEKNNLYNTTEYSNVNCACLTRSNFKGTIKTAAVTNRTYPFLKDQLDPGIDMETYPNFESCYKAMIEGKADAAIGSTTAATYVLNQHTSRGVNQAVMPNIVLAIRGAVSRDNRTLLFALNKAIAVSQPALDQAVIANVVNGNEGIINTLERLPLSFIIIMTLILLALVISLIIAIFLLVRSNKARVTVLNREIEVDSLTGAGSRRYGALLMNRELSVVQRDSSGPMLAMLDIDYFKAKNDIYGHEYGDHVLKRLVEVLRETLRESDDIIRWGGDEFLLICPHIDAEAADAILKRAVEAVSDADFLLDGKGDKITISVGASFFRKGETDVETALRRCDTALYKAKTVQNTYRIIL